MNSTQDSHVARAGLTVALLVLASCGTAQPPPVASGPRARDIATLIGPRLGAGPRHIIGVAAAVIDADGRLSVFASGDSGLGSQRIDADSVFEIGSITKVFTATLLAVMLDRGEVHLDDPVGMYLPATVHVPERAGRRITLLDLATHASGLPRTPGNLHPADPSNPAADYTVAQLYDFLNHFTLTRDIGAQYEYSNVGVGLLGHALARRAGMTYEQALTQRVLTPLDMAHTAVTLSPWMTAHLARGHDAEGDVTSNWDIVTLAGAGGLRSTANDMLRFLRANLDPGSSQLARVIQMTHDTRRPTENPDMTIGLAWQIQHLDGGRQIVWHNGGTGGYRTWIGFDPARRVGALVLTNSSVSPDDLGLALLDSVNVP